MLKAMFFKEWKDKANLLLFGLAIQVLIVLASAGISDRANLRDLLHGSLLVIYFPFLALLLGSSAFEREFRGDAWAYLFSRPVKKSVIWTVKFLALLVFLLILWGAFLAITEAAFGVGSFAERLELPLSAGVDLSLLPLGFITSLSFFIIAFSLSFLSERSFSVFFASLIIAIGLSVGLHYAYLAALTAFRGELTNPRVAVVIYRWGPLLLSVALAAASLLTFVRADFSQPRKKITLFAKRSGLLLGAAAVLLGLWMAFLPGIREKGLWNVQVSGVDVYFAADKGLYRYDAAEDRLARLARAHPAFWVGPDSVREGTAVLYHEYRKTESKRWAWELWAMSRDGTGKRRILADDQLGSGLWMAAWRGIRLSPDGNQVLCSGLVDIESALAAKSSLWLVRTDGSGLENLPLDASIFQDLVAEEPTAVPPKKGQYLLSLVAWPEGSDAVLCIPTSWSARRQSKLVLYDLKSRAVKILFEAAKIGFGTAASPAQDRVAFTYRRGDEDGVHLAWIDLGTLEMRDVWSSGSRADAFSFHLRWSADGDKLAFVRSAADEDGKGCVVAVYSVEEGEVLAEKRLVRSEAATIAMDWLADGQRLVVNDRNENGLLILGPNLDVEKRIAFPDSTQYPVGAYVAGDKILLKDTPTNDLWRFDLRTGAWKKIY